MNIDRRIPFSGDEIDNWVTRWFPQRYYTDYEYKQKQFKAHHLLQLLDAFRITKESD